MTNFEDTINKGEDEQSIIYGYRRSKLRTAGTYIGYACTAFLLRLLYFWLPHLHLYSTHYRCSLEEADKILVRDQYKQLFVESVRVVSSSGVKLRRCLVGGSLGLHSSACSVARPCVDRSVWYEAPPPPLTELASDSGSTEVKATGGRAVIRQKSLDSVNDIGSVYTNNGTCPGFEDEAVYRYFIHKKIKYTWTTVEERFIRNDVFADTKCSHFHSASATNGLSDATAHREFVKYGENLVQIPLTPIWKLLLVQGLHPFYMFQLFSVIVWFNEDYTIYAIIIIVMSCISLTVTVAMAALNERNLRKTLVGSSLVNVFRDSDVPIELDSSRLVPGDVISIPKSGCLMQCDAALVSGTCIVNESMLTGESVPLLKTPLPGVDARFSVKEHAKHILFSGTRVIQTRHTDAVKAVVVRTGFTTSKGDLVRSILFPKPNVFTFNRDVINYLEVLAFFALSGFIYTVVLMKLRDERWQKIVIRALDLITIAVPPALPAAMTIGIAFAQRRLRNRQIFCIAPKAINVSGAINLVCFDKTGTLTESGLDLWAAVPVKGPSFLEPVPNPSSIPEPAQLLEAMATCHALTRIDGILSGDPLDLNMFQATGWQLDEPETIDYLRCDRLVNLLVKSPVSGLEIGVVRQFTFSSDLQRMSVIAGRLLEAGDGRLEEPLMAYVKGSPEMIHSLCLPESVPSDFHDQLMQYTSHGYRVIALACRQLPPEVTVQAAQKIPRDEVERQLKFLGLLVMENRLKPETKAAIGTLIRAAIRPVMVTGDNILTALSVARECGMIAEAEAAVIVQAASAVGHEGPRVEFAVYGDPRRKVTEAAVLSPSSTYRLAISGPSWQAVRNHFPQLVPRLAVSGAVFARFSPVQKSQLVEAQQELGYTVGMCGDGANDCGALKTAHAGISLSEAEASVASPFTSKEQNISCVIRLIQEGRCALVTSFGIFKFMACYSLCQFVAVLILYWVGTNLTNNQFIYEDLFLATSHFITFSLTGAYKGSIAKDPPSHRLLSFVTVSSITLQCALFTGVQTLAYFYVQWQPWFYPFLYDKESENMACYENSAVILVSMHQIIALAVAFSKSAPYRDTVFTNYAFLINNAVCVGVNLFVFFAPWDWLGQLLEIWDAPLDNPNLQLKFLLVGVSLGHFLLAQIVEFVVESVWFGRLVQRAAHLLAAKPKPFERVAKELKRERGQWPPISARYQRAGHRELLTFVNAGFSAAEETEEPEQQQQQQQQQQPAVDISGAERRKKAYYSAL